MKNNLTRTKKFIYSTITTALYQIVLFLSGFIVPKLMIQCYSSEINGLVSSITQFITYFNLVEAGLSSAAIYSLYKPIADNDYDEISSIVVATKKFYIKSGIAFVILVLILAILYPIFITTATLSTLKVSILVFILGFSSALEFFSLAKYRALLSADQKTYIISLSSIVYVILNTAIIYLLAKFKVDIVVLRGIALTAVMVRSIILMIYVKKNYPKINYNAKPKKNALSKRWYALYMQILGAIHTGAPIIILTCVVRNLILVSVFSVYNMVVTGLHGIMQIFSSGLSASFGDVIVRKQHETLKKTYQEFELAYLSCMTIVYTVAISTIMPFIKIYTSGITDANYYLPIVGFLIIINAFLYNLKSPQSMLLIAAGLYKESRVQTTIQGLIMIIFGIIGGIFYGIEGILIASIISNIYRDIDLLFFIPKNVTKLPIKNTLKRWIHMLLCFAIVSIISINIHIFNITNYFNWGIMAICVGIFSLLIVLLNAILFDKEALLGLFEHVKGAFVNGKTKDSRI